MIKVTCKVKVNAIDGMPTKVTDEEDLIVQSAYPGQVEIVIGGKRYTVNKNDLEAAIENAGNISY